MLEQYTYHLEEPLCSSRNKRVDPQFKYGKLDVAGLNMPRTWNATLITAVVAYVLEKIGRPKLWIRQKDGGLSDILGNMGNLVWVGIGVAIAIVIGAVVVDALLNTSASLNFGTNQVSNITKEISQPISQAYTTTGPTVVTVAFIAILIGVFIGLWAYFQEESRKAQQR